MTEIETGNVTRYFKPLDLENGIPKSSGFERRRQIGEKYLSVYWLEFFAEETEVENIRKVKAYMEQKGFSCKPNGSFAILNIQQSKEYIFKKESLDISYREEKLPHCGIFHEADDLLIAKLLTECVQNKYPVRNLVDSTNSPP